MRTEIVAGTTTFLTMAYIAFVNPPILAAAGMDVDAVFVATCLAAAFGSLVMGLFANYPVALAPGMGLNAFFACVVVKSMGPFFAAALVGVFIAGLIFLAVGATPAREWLINAFSKSQRRENRARPPALGMPFTYSIATGIGLGLITYIAVKLLSGRLAPLSPAVLLIGAVFVLHFALGRGGGASAKRTESKSRNCRSGSKMLVNWSEIGQIYCAKSAPKSFGRNAVSSTSASARDAAFGRGGRRRRHNWLGTEARAEASSSPRPFRFARSDRTHHHQAALFPARRSGSLRSAWQ